MRAQIRDPMYSGEASNEMTRSIQRMGKWRKGRRVRARAAKAAKKTTVQHGRWPEVDRAVQAMQDAAQAVICMTQHNARLAEVAMQSLRQADEGFAKVIQQQMREEEGGKRADGTTKARQERQYGEARWGAEGSGRCTESVARREEGGAERQGVRRRQVRFTGGAGQK